MHFNSFRTPLSRALAGKRVYHSEYTCLRKDGSTFPCLFYFAVKYRMIGKIDQTSLDSFEKSS